MGGLGRGFRIGKKRLDAGRIGEGSGGKEAQFPVATLKKPLGLAGSALKAGGMFVGGPGEGVGHGLPGPVEAQLQFAADLPGVVGRGHLDQGGPEKHQAPEERDEVAEEREIQVSTDQKSLAEAPEGDG